MKRILAMLLSVICALSFTCVSTYADEKSEDEEKAANLTSAGLYTITVTAQKTASSTPVVYVYTVRAY